MGRCAPASQAEAEVRSGLPRPLPAFASAWSERLHKLMWALGESPHKIAARWGQKSRSSVERILKGGRPQPWWVLRLQSLEERFAQDLRDLGEGRIRISRGSGRGWSQWRRNDKRSQARSGNREALGKVGLARRRIPRPSQEKVFVSPYHGTGALGYSTHGIGRSATPPSGSGSTREGVVG